MGKVREKIRRGPQSVTRLRQALEEAYSKYTVDHVDTDPLKYPHRFSNSKDREFVAFLSAILAFGNVKAIFHSIEAVLSELGSNPVHELTNGFFEENHRLEEFKHRWITGRDIQVFLKALSQIYLEHGSLESFFGIGRNGNFRSGIDSFSLRFNGIMKEIAGKRLSRGIKFLVPAPSGGSGCKRLNLFFRWVVRRSPPDLGLWKSVEPCELFLPIDTHLARIVRYIGLTKLRTTGWNMVEEATHALSRMDPEDPIRFDFSLSRMGILKQCKHKRDDELCPRCPLFSICLLAS